MATATINLPKETVEGLGRVAEQRGVAVADLAQEAIRQYLHREAERKIAQEEVAYRAQHSLLLEQYEGRFIAMHEGQVVDHDEDELRLYLRIRHRYPLLGVLIKRVSPEVDEKWAVRSPRLRLLEFFLNSGDMLLLGRLAQLPGRFGKVGVLP